jgi:YbbR domain-containing protein
MDSWLQRKWVLKTISFLLALLLWFIISEPMFPFSITRSSTTVRGVQVEYRYNSGLYQLSGGKQSVDITFTGDRGTLSRLPYYHVFVDLTKLPAGTYPTVPVQVSGLPINVRYSTKPSTIPVKIEEKITKTIPVTIVTQGKVASGYELLPIKYAPKAVQVSGTKREVEKIAYITATVDVTGLKQTVKKNVKLVVHSKTSTAPIVQLSSAETTVTIPVQSNQTERTEIAYRDLPLRISISDPPPEGYKVESITPSVEKVRVYGPVDQLKKFTTYPGVTLDLSQITEDRTIVTDVKVISPAEKVTPNKIEIYVKMVRTSSVENE